MRNKFIFIAILIAATALPSCHVGRFFIWNFADIHDYRKFREAVIPRQGEVFHFAEGKPGSLRMPDTINVYGKQYTFNHFLKKTKTVAFLVIRNDSILYRNFLRGYTDSSIVPSFSMAKSFVSMLVGIAIRDGAIGSVHDPITKYLPELKSPGFDKITLENLLDMQSGIRFNEGYFNPFGGVAKYYYGLNLSHYIRHLKVAHAPGEKFEYRSVNAQLLGMAVERATHMKLADYMEQQIWSRIGAQYNAGWSIDSRKDSEAKAFCCFNAHATDYAKLGRLYLHKGNWNGRQIVPADWVSKSLDATGKNRGIYSYQWWHTYMGKGADFMAQGFLGQFIYVYPSKNIIIVRLGAKEGSSAWGALMCAIAQNS